MYTKRSNCTLEWTTKRHGSVLFLGIPCDDLVFCSTITMNANAILIEPPYQAVLRPGDGWRNKLFGIVKDLKVKLGFYNNVDRGSIAVKPLLTVDFYGYLIVYMVFFAQDCEFKCTSKNSGSKCAEDQQGLLCRLCRFQFSSKILSARRGTRKRCIFIRVISNMLMIYFLKKNFSF